MSEQLFHFNGIDATSGDYALSLTESQLYTLASGGRLESPDELELLEAKRRAGNAHYGVADGIEPSDLASAGWGVIFPFVKPGSPEARRQLALREALRPLLDHRRTQANRTSELYQELILRPGETSQDFLARVSNGLVSYGPVDPLKGVPYYLLLVGSPEEIPFEFQYQLGVQYAVGRLDLDSVEAFAWYAQSVLAAETGRVILPRRAAFFGVQNDDDAATSLSTKELVTPLSQHPSDAKYQQFWKGWQVETHLGENARRSHLEQLLTDAPALLFTASHGMSFPRGHERQLHHQGALLCQDWPGPLAWGHQPVPEQFYFAGDHLGKDANLHGSMVFLFACYGAGTPQKDQFFKNSGDQSPKELAARNFTAALPKAMLGREKGGALAVIGHVDRAWSYSFSMPGRVRNASQHAPFESSLRSLARGLPVGAALEAFDSTYAEKSTALTAYLHEVGNGYRPKSYELGELWTSNNDARGYVLLGDPAVRLSVQSPEESPRPREVPTLSLSPETTAALASFASAASAASAAPAPAVPASSLQASTASASAAPASSFQAAAAPAPAGGAEARGLSFGWLGGGRPEAPAPRTPSVFERLVSNLGERLSQALQDAASLEIKTYTADQLQQVTFQNGQPEGAELRALTRIALDGDIVSCVPTTEGELDRELWEVHLQLVKQAQETRTELLRTLLNAASSLVKLGG